MSEIAREMIFEYDGISSEQLGLMIVHKDGLLESHFGLNREINTERNPSVDMPYHFGNEDTPIEGSMRIFSETPWTLAQRRKVAEFLYKNTYRPFISEDNPDIEYHLMFCGESVLSTGMGERGFIDVDFICDAPWAWSKPLITKYNLTLSELKDYFYFEIDNISNATNCVYYNAMEIQIDLPEEVGNTSSSFGANPEAQTYTIRNLKNQSDKQAFEIKSTMKHPFYPNESVYINMRDGNVMSDHDDFRFKSVNQNFIKLERGINRLEISASDKTMWRKGVHDIEPFLQLTVKCQFPIIM